MSLAEAPDRWFRLFCKARPTVGAKLLGVDVRIRGLSRLEENIIADECVGLPRSRAALRYQAGIIAASVVDAGGAVVFADASELGGLTAARLGYVWETVAKARETVAPFRDAAFFKAMEDGAAHASNATVATALGNCIDVAYGYAVMRTVPRPERFFGVSPGELTDGQWAAYWAARHVVVAGEKR